MLRSKMRVVAVVRGRALRFLGMGWSAHGTMKVLEPDPTRASAPRPIRGWRGVGFRNLGLWLMLRRRPHWRKKIMHALESSSSVPSVPAGGSVAGGSEPVIAVRDLGRMYHLFNRPQDRLKQAFLWGRKQLYREFWALRNVSFELGRGQTLGIVGRNGSGKSTLLQILAGVLQPTTGEVKVNGRVAALLELGSGFNVEYSGRENVFLNGAILGVPRAQMAERFEEIERFAEIGEFIDQPVKTYSSGMFVRLAFAVTTCVDADVLLIDEALAVGDVFFRQKCYARLEMLRERGVSIVLVSHAMTDVEQFCRDGLLLHHGNVMYQGSSKEAVRRYYLVEQEERAVGSGGGAVSSLQSPVASGEAAIGSQPSAANDGLTADRVPACGRLPTADSDDVGWPAASELLDISQLSQVSNGWARCTASAITNVAGKAARVFEQGETAVFFHEFELLRDIEVPVAGITITSDQGICVHGRNTLQLDTGVPLRAAAGAKLRFRQEVKLEIAVREYTFEAGLAAIGRGDYERRSMLPHEELEGRVLRLCHLPVVAHFAVIFRREGKPIQLLHHGAANLPGSCRVAVV